MKTLLLSLLGGWLLAGCIQPFPIPQGPVPARLVVEGLVTPDSTPCTVTLSWLGGFGYAASTEHFLHRQAVKGATVSIAADDGEKVALTEQQPGRYTAPPGFRGVVGRSYQLEVRLPDGKSYASSPEKLAPVPGIDSVLVRPARQTFHFQFPDGYNLYVRVQDPAQQQNYYRWTAYGWLHRKTQGVWDAWSQMWVKQYCWVRFESSVVALASDESFNGNLLPQQFVMFSPLYWRGWQFLEIQQYSLSKEAYLFWRAFEDQRTRSSGLFEPQPGSVPGNVRNIQQPDDYALGYFGASAVVRRRLIIPGDTATDFTLERGGATRPQFIVPGACEAVVPGGTTVSPTVW